MSYRFLDHAQTELDAGRRLQASEKVWGAAAHLLKAIGKQRGWNTRGHANIGFVNAQLAEEFKRPGLHTLFNTPNSMHTNFYENTRGDEAIQEAIHQTRQYVGEINNLRKEQPKRFTIQNDNDQNRLGTLLGVNPKDLEARVPIGLTHTRGFSRQGGGEFIPPGRAGDDPGNTPDDGTPAKRPPPDKPRPDNSGSREIRRPQDRKPQNGKSQKPVLPAQEPPGPGMIAGVPNGGQPRPKRRRPRVQKPKPIFPKVGTGRRRATRAAPPGFNPPRLPGQRR